LKHPDALQIQLYIDEAQVCDALRSKTINNKLVSCILHWGILK
jgi:hypothetical protein